MKYTDFYKPEEITVAKIWQVISAALFRKPVPQIQQDEMRRTFYMGFTEAFKLMTDISEAFAEDQASRILARLHEEVNVFHAQEIAKLLPEKYQTGVDPAVGQSKTVEQVIRREDYQGSEPEYIREFLKELAKDIHRKMPDKWGFTLFIFDVDAGANGNLLYLSSARREDMVKVIREFLEKQPQ